MGKKYKFASFKGNWLGIFGAQVQAASNKTTSPRWCDELRETEEKLMQNREKNRRCSGCYEELVRTHGKNYAQKCCKRISTYCVNCPNKPFLCLVCYQKKHSKIWCGHSLEDFLSSTLIKLLFKFWWFSCKEITVFDNKCGWCLYFYFLGFSSLL
jgi:hypothetical protein